MKLTTKGKEELALALLLWRDFKSQGRYDVEIIKQMFEFADHLGIRQELDKMMVKLPPMSIIPR